MRGAIQFKGVSFHYHEADGDDTQPGAALEEISFSLDAGQTLALVGQTGAGKSTVAKLMNRIYDVDAGQVMVDGVDVREWNLAALRQQISIIEQDIFLFSRSIGENIAFGKPDATRDRNRSGSPSGAGPRIHHELS